MGKEEKKKQIEERRLKILLNDYNITNEKIEQFIRAQVGYFVSGNVIVFGILGIFGYSDEALGYTEILYLIPITLLTYFGTIMYHYQRTLALQGYKMYLEEKINSLAGEQLIFYGKLGMRYLEKENRFVVFNLLSYGVLFLISIFISVLATIYNINEISEFIIIGILVFTVLLSSIFIWASLKVKKTPSFIYGKSFAENIGK